MVESVNLINVDFEILRCSFYIIKMIFFIKYLQVTYGWMC